MYHLVQDLQNPGHYYIYHKHKMSGLSSLNIQQLIVKYIASSGTFDPYPENMEILGDTTYALHYVHGDHILALDVDLLPSWVFELSPLDQLDLDHPELRPTTDGKIVTSVPTELDLLHLRSTHPELFL